MNITIAGLGYVGTSIGILLSTKHRVIFYDIDKKKLDLINKKKSPIDDPDISKFLKEKKLKFTTTTSSKEAFKNSDFIVICTPTNYNPKTNQFDTSSIEQVLKKIFENNISSASIIIRSTVPVGYTKEIRKIFSYKKIFFSPEFLREGSALKDNLYPSRVIIGGKDSSAKKFAELLIDAAELSKDEIPLLFMNSNEAEAVKLFANTYLAMRIAYFNELDSYCVVNKIDTRSVINGIGYDKRIGNYYNNPSFGYGGYCLPKDTRQLLNSFSKVPNNIIKATIDSNYTRKKFIADIILSKNPKNVGVYRLVMKSESDNFRESAVFDIIEILIEKGIDIFVFEPGLKTNIRGVSQILDLEKFIDKSDLIITNRYSKELDCVKEKVFTRDLFGNN